MAYHSFQAIGLGMMGVSQSINPEDTDPASYSNSHSHSLPSHLHFLTIVAKINNLNRSLCVFPIINVTNRKPGIRAR